MQNANIYSEATDLFQFPPFLRYSFVPSPEAQKKAYLLTQSHTAADLLSDEDGSYSRLCARTCKSKTDGHCSSSAAHIIKLILKGFNARPFFLDLEDSPPRLDFKIIAEDKIIPCLL